MEDMSKEAEEILEAIRRYGPLRSVELVKMLGVSTKTIYKHLTKLLDEQLIKKTGTTPRVFYVARDEQADGVAVFDESDQLIEQNYIYVSPSGEMTRGISGFQLWCERNGSDFSKEKKLFSQRFKSIQKMKNSGLISAKKTILSGGKALQLDNIFFSDFYTFDHFGKTKLGQLVYLGKSSQNKELIGEIAKNIRPAIEGIIEKYDIEFVCFIPPTIDRKVQFLDVLKKRLKLGLPEIVATKIPSVTKVPQKTLRKLEDRIINAKTTIAVNPNQQIGANVLIIDDATGSGATLNETAGKIRNVAKKKIKIIGYSVVGSYKGFDVISEV
jgi:DNA-binding Lrp family transcriptional regulator